MIDLREIKLLNKKTYNGYEFSAADITALVKNEDYRFYGGRVEYYTVAKNNPNVVILLEAYDNSYRVVDIGLISEQVGEQVEEEKYICPNCNREFKTKAGLGKHTKSCK